MQRSLISAIIGSLTCASLLCLISEPTFARPEYVRHGYFTCTSCHVAPAGGGLLKAYGRMVASEKLTTWAQENEDGPLHGAFEPSENWAVGGGVRWLQTYKDDKQVRKGQVFRMNSDLDGGVRLGEGLFKQARLWITGRVGIEGGPDKTPTGEKIDHRAVSSSHYLQWEPSEGYYVRVGKFVTRYGLMIPDHSASVRAGTGLATGSETRQIEATYNSKILDITLSKFQKSKDRRLDLGANNELWIDLESARQEDGAAAHASFFLLERYRVGAQALQGSSDEGKRWLRGIHAALPVGTNWTILHETDWQSAAGINSHLTWTKVIFDSAKGVSPYTWIEATRPDMRTTKGRRDGVGTGLSLRPRPHFNLDFATGLSLDRDAYTYSINGRAIAHYWF